MKQEKLSQIFRLIRQGYHVRGWTGSRQTGEDYVESLDPKQAWARKRPVGPWQKVPPFKGNL